MQTLMVIYSYNI